MLQKKNVLLAWALMLVILSSLFNVPLALAQSAALVRVDPGTTSANVNDPVNLTIKAENISNLTAMEIHLSFNPAVVEVVSMSNGGFVAADFVVQNTFDNSAGTIDYAVAQINRSPVQGSGTLLNIALRAKNNGVSALALRPTQAAPGGLLFSDVNGMSIAASWAGNGSITIGGGVTAIPTTSTPGPVTATASSTAAAITPVTPTSGPAVTAAPVTATPTPTSTPQGNILGVHTVRWGESLYCIGRAYGVSPWAIAQTNNVVWWPFFIFPGQKLSIPNVTWTQISQGPVCAAQFSISPTATLPLITVTPAPSSAACRAFHIVSAGQTLYRIGLSYGVSYQEIARVNHIANPALIYSGQRLCIP